MTFLEIFQMCKSLAGIPGAIPSTVIGQTGELGRMVNWVMLAWLEIQRQREDWLWMRKNFSFNTIAHKGSYTPDETGLTDWANWRHDSFRSYLTSAGVGTEIWLQEDDYNSFRDYWLLGARKITYSRPIAISVGPDKGLYLGLSPDQVYTISGEYYKTPQVLTNNTDAPEMPSRFHMAIVHKALMKFGIYIAASEVIQENQAEYSTIMNKIEADQTDMITIAGALI